MSENDIYTQIAHASGVSRDDVKKVLHAYGYCGEIISPETVRLERIATALEGIAEALSPNTVYSAYGEGLAEAIQNSIARGLRGVEVPR